MEPRKAGQIRYVRIAIVTGVFLSNQYEIFMVLLPRQMWSTLREKESLNLGRFAKVSLKPYGSSTAFRLTLSSSGDLTPCPRTRHES